MHNKSIHLLISIIFTLALFLVFYPKFYTSTDEREYIQNAYYILEGDISIINSECFDGAYCGYLGNDGYVSKYNLGLSLILIPFVAIDWRLSFVVPLIFFAISIFVFAKTIRYYKIPDQFIYLFAFFPIFIYYSKKPLSEIPSMALILVLYYVLYIWNGNLSLKSLILGTTDGLLVLIRYSNAITVIIFSLSFIFHSFNLNSDLKKVLKQKIGLLISVPFALLFFYINHKYYDGLISSGYSLSGEEFFIDKNIILKQLIYYLGFLNLLYPGMLFLGLKSKIKAKLEVYLIFVGFLLFYAGFPGYHFKSGILDLIFGLRFFVPIIPLLMIPYFEILSERLKILKNASSSTAKFQWQNILKFSLLFSILLLVVNSIGMAYIYLDRTKDLKNESDSIYKNYAEIGQYESSNIEDRILINDAFRKGKIWFYIVK